ncbi:hypothetical protein GCM10025767_23680 [Thalassotalea piscium]
MIKLNEKVNKYIATSPLLIKTRKQKKAVITPTAILITKLKVVVAGSFLLFRI